MLGIGIGLGCIGDILYISIKTSLNWRGQYLSYYIDPRPFELFTWRNGLKQVMQTYL